MVTAASRRTRRTWRWVSARSGGGGPGGHLACALVGSRKQGDGLAGDQPLDPGFRGDDAVLEQEPDVQVGTGLELDDRFLGVDDEDRREAEPAEVLAHHEGGGAWLGEEAGIEVREGGGGVAPGDHPGSTLG